MKSIGKRIIALCLTAALSLTNVWNSADIAYAANGENVDFIIKGSDFAGAIEEMIRGGAQPVTEADLNFTDGKLEKYYQLFLDGQDPLYEFYPEFDGLGMEAEIRTFIRLPEGTDDGYTLTGEEEIVILYINNGDSTMGFSTVIELSDGTEKRTKRVSVKDYEHAFSNNRIDYGAPVVSSGSKQETRAAEETEIKETEDAQLSGTGTDEIEDVTGDAVQSGTEAADTTEKTDITENVDTSENTDASKETDMPENADTSETADAPENEDAPEKADTPEAEQDTPDSDRENDSEVQSSEPVAARSAHEAPRVAVNQEDAEAAGKDNTHPANADNKVTADITSAEGAAEGMPADNDMTLSREESGYNGQSAADQESGTEDALPSDEPESSVPESGDGAAQESSSLESSSQDSTSGDNMPETSAPDASMPDTTMPDASMPETTMPETTVPETTVPETTAETPSSSEEMTATPSEPEHQENTTPSIGYGDLVGMGGCSTAKAYITTLGKLKVLEDVEGYKITYEISPESEGTVQKGPRSVAEGESITFGVKAEEGYMVESAAANGSELESESVENGITWYVLENIEEDQKIEITMAELGEPPEFFKTFQMSDGMDITISADSGVLPWGTYATVEIVTNQVEDVIKEKVGEQGQAIIAAPAYDINLWQGNEKLDSEEWNRNGQVKVSFSGSLMEKLSQQSEAAQVLWVKDQDEAVEVMQDSHREIPAGQAIDELSCVTSHFTTFSPVFFGETGDAAREFDIEQEGLMDAGYPILTVCDKNNQELDILETTDENGVTRITLADGKPLPRDIRTWFEISYAMENGADSSLKDYIVKAGDCFVYKFPANILYDAAGFDVKDASGGIIGNASIAKDGTIKISITQSQVGQKFKGTAGVRGSVDFTGENKDKTEIVIHQGDLDKTLVFDKVPVVQKHSVSVKKSHNNNKWADSEQEKSGDVRYSPMGIPEAVRFHVTIEAGKDNTMDLTGIQISDKFNDNKKDVISFDTKTGITLESISQESAIAKAEFETPEGGNGTKMFIKLLDASGNPASMKTGEKVVLNYWMNIEPGAWGKTKEADKDGTNVSASLNLSFSNKVTVTSTEGASGSADSSFSHTVSIVTKSGITHYNESIDEGGEVIPVFIEYHVYVNPNLLNLTGWTVKDALDLNSSGQDGQEYLGQVFVTAYDKSGNGGQEINAWTIETDKESGSQKAKTWEWKIPEPGNYFYDFKYYTTVNEPKGSNLNNEIQMIAPEGSGYPGVGGGTQIGFLYNTYTLAKKNLSSDMKENSQEPTNQNKPGVIGWGEEFGTIRWQSVLTPYSNGVTDSETAVIPKDAVYSDELTVLQWNAGEVNKYLDKHTFGSLDTLKSSFVLKDGNGKEISPADGVYELALDKSSGNRVFTVTFNQAVKGPVTIEYDSRVEASAFAEFSRAAADNLRFKNTAKLTIQGSTWTRWSTQPYYIDDYLSKSVAQTDNKNGKVVWTLEINKGYGNGSAPQELSKFEKVDIVETIPQGMVLESIKFKNMNYTLSEQKGDYTVEMDGDVQKVTIHLNKVAENFSGYDMDKHVNLNVTTKITSPTIKDFVNKAQMFIDDTALYQVSAKTSINKGFLEKGMEYSGSTAPSAVYTILVNKPGSDISSTTLTVKDTLGNDKMMYLPDSFKVINDKTGASIQEAVIHIGERTFEISNLPDETPIRIEYRVMLNGAVNTTINTRNTAQLFYSSSESIEDTVEENVKIVKPYATGTGDFSIRIYKVDQSGQPLDGAEFTLYKADQVDGDLEPVGTYKPEKGEQGTSYSALIQGLVKGQLYYLDETTVPEEYQKADGRYFIIPGDKGAENIPAGVLIVENTGIPFTFENVKNQGSLKITKEVTGGDVSQQGAEEFYFTVRNGSRYYNKKGESWAGIPQVIHLYYTPDGTENSVVIPLPVGEYTVTEVADSEGTPINGDNFSYEVRVNGKEGDTVSVSVSSGQQTDVLYDNHEPAGPPSGGGTETPGGGTETPGGGSGGSGGTGGSGGGSNRYDPSGGPGTTVSIEPEQVPMAQWPDDSDLMTILDEDVPLAPLPKTGEGPRSYYLIAMISSLVTGLYIAFSHRKKEV